MLTTKRRKSSFGKDGRRLNGDSSACSSALPFTYRPRQSDTNLLSRMNNNPLCVVKRAPILSGLSVPSSKLCTPFRRPMRKRRAYDKNADVALKKSSLGQKRRMDGMKHLLARAGKGLKFKLRRVDDENRDSDAESAEDESDNEEETPFEPLLVWKSPHNGGDAIGLSGRMMTEMQADEYGIEQSVKVMRAAPIEAYSKEDKFVPPVLAKWLRPHQREGVLFMYECVMGMKNYKGNGCILADDMGLGKTLQSVALIYTLLKTGITPNKEPTAKRVIVVCPCSLVKNWDNEFIKWLGPNAVKCLTLAESDRKTVERSMDLFVKTKMFQILIVSYETLRTHVGRLNKVKDSCDLLVCDEAHRLKNNENQTSKALASLPVRRRVLLTGTPMQNDLQEFFAMVDFTNPGVLGTQEEFRKKILFPVLRGREPDATERQKQKMMNVQNDMSILVNEFILRRINTLNAEHLPPKLVQVVCCNLTEIQRNMYEHLVTSKAMHHVLNGKQVNCLGSIQMLMKLANHPSLVIEDNSRAGNSTGRRAAARTVSYAEDEKSSATPGADGISKFLPIDVGTGGRKMNMPVRPEWSGKMFVLYRLIREMRKPGNGNDKIVVVSNYTQTLDLIGRMCRENNWGFCRLDGSISMKKRQKMVEDFNDPNSSLVAFLLSSKAGGCGLNLIGGNRLVLFDPDWNPAVDKQAAARCWRDGQKKRCFTYRFLATGTVEEKIFQRQLSKEGLQSIVDDKEQVNALSTKDLRNLFKLRRGTPSDTHDKLRCERCKIFADDADQNAIKVLPKQLSTCLDLMKVMMSNDDAEMFSTPLNPEVHGVTSEEYSKSVKRPIDLGTIQSKLRANLSLGTSYKSPSAFSKEVNRIFTNVMKVWEPGHELADAARRLQCWWLEEWSKLVPRLMNMKADDDDKENAEPNNATNLIENSNVNCKFISNERGDDYQEQIGMPDEENMRDWSHHHDTDTVDDPIFRAAMKGYDTVSFIFGLEVTWSLIQQRQQEEEEKQAMLELERLQTIDQEALESKGDKGGANEKIASNNKKGDEEIKPSSTIPQNVEGIDQKDESLLVDDSQDSRNWPCPVCTFENETSVKKCSMCGAMKI